MRTRATMNSQHTAACVAGLLNKYGYSAHLHRYRPGAVTLHTDAPRYLVYETEREVVYG